MLILPMAAEIYLSVFKRVIDGQVGQQNANDETIDCIDHLFESRSALLSKSASNLSLFLVIREIVLKTLAGVDCFYHAPNSVIH